MQEDVQDKIEVEDAPKTSDEDRDRPIEKLEGDRAEKEEVELEIGELEERENVQQAFDDAQTDDIGKNLLYMHKLPYHVTTFAARMECYNEMIEQKVNYETKIR